MSRAFTDEELDKLQAIMDAVPDYFDDVEEIQCPHCGEKQGSFESSDQSFYDESGIVHRCDDNDRKKVFTIYPSCSWSYSTEANSDE